MTRAETTGQTAPASLAGALVIVDALTAERDKAIRERNDLKAELDNVLPALLTALEESARHVTLAQNYKNERDAAESRVEDLLDDLEEAQGELADAKRAAEWNADA